MALDIARNVGLADLAEVDGAARAHLAQEGADERQMVDDGLRRQTSFLPQIVAERVSKICSCGVSGRSIAGAIAPASRSTDSKRLRAARSPGYMDCFLDRCRRYCSTIRSLRSVGIERDARKPAQEIAEQAEGSPCAVAPKPLLDETRRVKLHELPVGLTPQALEKPAPA